MNAISIFMTALFICTGAYLTWIFLKLKKNYSALSVLFLTLFLGWILFKFDSDLRIFGSAFFLAIFGKTILKISRMIIEAHNRYE